MTVVFTVGALLFEVLSFLFLFSYCYGKPFKLDGITGIIVVINILFITFINVLGWNAIASFIVFIILMIYCGLKYGWKWKELVVNFLLTLLIIGVTQICLILTVDKLVRHILDEVINRFIENGIMFVVILGLKNAKLHEVSKFLQTKGKIIGFITGISTFAVIFVMIMYKVYKKMELNEYLFLFLYMMFGYIVFAFWQRSRIKQVEMDTERQCYDKYSKTYEELIDVVRMRQHEFDNQLNTIISLHYTTNTYAELVEAQQEYISAITMENRYNKLLKEGNLFFIGFLYGKFQNLSKAGIQIDYRICVGQLERYEIPVYKLIEVANDLITNAADALEQYKEKKLYVEALENDEELVLEVRNVGKPLEPDYIERCFEKGYSSKGTGRGYGLYNVKTICNRYHIDILFENINLQNKNWICFKLIKRNCTE